ncbi:MAG: alpha/beta hydrolase [Pseudomonadota bacterium]
MHVHAFHADKPDSVVFLHGAHTGGWMWKNVVAELTDFHCLCIDLPGHGDSAGIAWSSFAAVSDAVAKCIEKHAGGRCHVVGFSLGAYIALHLLARAPQCVDTALFSGVQSRPIPRAWALKPVASLLAPFIHTSWYLKLGAKGMSIPDADQPEFIRQCQRNTKQAFRQINREAWSFTPPSAALTGTHRKLFLAGAREHSLVTTSLTDFAEANAALSALVPGLGHAWCAEDPALFASVVRHWIKDQPLPATLEPVK